MQPSHWVQQGLQRYDDADGAGVDTWRILQLLGYHQDKLARLQLVVGVDEWQCWSALVGG